LPEGVQLLKPLARRLVELTSVHRQEAGADLAPLETDPELLPAARAHALDMLERGYFDRVTPGGSTRATAWRSCTGGWSEVSARI
jgi:uncharacterized protein YkwD